MDSNARDVQKNNADSSPEEVSRINDRKKPLDTAKLDEVNDGLSSSNMTSQVTVDKNTIEVDENSDEELQLKWDDDEMDEDISVYKPPTTADTGQNVNDEKSIENDDDLLVEDDCIVIEEPVPIINIGDDSVDNNIQNAVEIRNDVDVIDNKMATDDDLIFIEDDESSDKVIDSNIVSGCDETDLLPNLKIKEEILEADIVEDKDIIIKANLDHGLVEPNMMLEIPTQEIIDCLDDDVSISNDDVMSSTFDVTLDDDVNKPNKANPINKKDKINKMDDIGTDNIISMKPDDRSFSSKTSNNTITTEHFQKPICAPKLTGQSSETASKVSTNQRTAADRLTITTIKTEKSEDTAKEQSVISSENDDIKQDSVTGELVMKMEEDSNDVAESTNTKEFDKPYEEITIDESVIKFEVDENLSDSHNKKSMSENNESHSKLTMVGKEGTSQKDQSSDPLPSTSQASDKSEETKAGEQMPDFFNRAGEVSDTLGLFMESSRVMDDDEDDDEDYDQDESSSQTAADNSDDSNQQQPEQETTEELGEKQMKSFLPSENRGQTEFQFNNSKSKTEKEVLQEKDDKSSVLEVEKADAEMDNDDHCDKETEDNAIAVDDEPTAIAVDDEPTAIAVDDEPTAIAVDDEPTAIAVDDELITKKDLGVESITIDEMNEMKIEGEFSSDQAMDIESKKANETDNASKNSIGILETLLTIPISTDGKPEEPLLSSDRRSSGDQKESMLDYVDLEESSSEDDIQLCQDQYEPPDDVMEATSADPPSDLPSEDIPSKDLSSAGLPAPAELAKPDGSVESLTLKASEASPKESCEPDSTSAVPEEQAKTPEESSKPQLSSEVFSLDSDEEDVAVKPDETKASPAQPPEQTKDNKCVNILCKSGGKAVYYPADSSVQVFFEATKRKRDSVCANCAQIYANRNKRLVDGIRDLTPLLKLEHGKVSADLVEISDSESDEETDIRAEDKELIGEKEAKFVDENLTNAINDAWLKFKLDNRLDEAEKSLDVEMKNLEKESKEIDTLLNECQIATDKLRNELYLTFKPNRHECTPLTIYDTPNQKFVIGESSMKRRSTSKMENRAKKPAIPLGYAPLNKDKSSSNKIFGDDDRDVAVLKVSAESAPASLPPLGEMARPALQPGWTVLAATGGSAAWITAKVLFINGTSNGFTMVRVKFENMQPKCVVKLLSARYIAYNKPAKVRMTIGTRIIALFKSSTKSTRRNFFYSGIVAEVPNPVNNYRYLVFFDDGYAQYVNHADTRVVCEFSPLVWEEVQPQSRQFVRDYLVAYPERPMVRLHAGQWLKTEWNGKWWMALVVKVDASLVQVQFEQDNRTEWIYRGSTRLAPLYLELKAAGKARARPRMNPRYKSNMPYVEYTREDQNKAPPVVEKRESRQRAVAKKSTSNSFQSQPSTPASPSEASLKVTSRVVFYTPKIAVKPYKMVPHTCSPKCKRTDVIPLKDLRTYNPLAKPLLSGWERQIVRFKGLREVMYRTPCGRRVRNIRELHFYLMTTNSDMSVDLFDFEPDTHCLAEFVMNTYLVGKKDLSHGKENVPVPCVNYYDESLPEFCSYNTERTPTAGVPLNLDPDFLCGCDCTDDCMDKTKCACWRMTLEGAKTIGLSGPNVGYVYKRLPEPLPSGIYECNSRCKCKHTCLNRVAQHPLQLKLQVFKTLNRGWGIRALNDVPKGAFLCVYAGNLLTDATANMDGLNEGDEYLAELDYIEVVEQMKEGYEAEVAEADKKLDKKNENGDSEDGEISSEEEGLGDKMEEGDHDFQPGNCGGVLTFNKHLRKRGNNNTKEGEQPKENDAEQPKEKVGEQPIAKVGEQPNEKVGEQMNEKVGEQLNEKVGEQPDEKVEEQPIEKVGEQPIEKVGEQPNEKVGEQPNEKVEEQPKENDEVQQKEKDAEKPTEKEAEAMEVDEDCITISDDEEVREPSRFTAQTDMATNDFASKYRSVRSYFGKDEACYIMDAKVQGNIGRYLNHSCSPNVFVQNVFVDTHDPRFPWVAFFALTHIKSGTELTWNYNYDVGSVPGKVLYCYCRAPNCRGRLL